MTSKPKSSRMKVQQHRERLREQGLRPIQIWVPDVRPRAFRAEGNRQSRLVAVSLVRVRTKLSSTPSPTGAMNEARRSLDSFGWPGLCRKGAACCHRAG